MDQTAQINLAMVIMCYLLCLVAGYPRISGAVFVACTAISVLCTYIPISDIENFCFMVSLVFIDRLLKGFFTHPPPPRPLSGFERLPVEILELIFENAALEPNRVRTGADFAALFQINSVSRQVALRMTMPRYKHRIRFDIGSTFESTPFWYLNMGAVPNGFFPDRPPVTLECPVTQTGIIHRPIKALDQIQHVIIKIVVWNNIWQPCAKPLCEAIRQFGINQDCKLTIIMVTPGHSLAIWMPEFVHQFGLYIFGSAHHRLWYEIFNHTKTTDDLWMMQCQVPFATARYAPGWAAYLSLNGDEPDPIRLRNLSFREQVHHLWFNVMDAWFNFFRFNKGYELRVVLRMLDDGLAKVWLFMRTYNKIMALTVLVTGILLALIMVR